MRDTVLKLTRAYWFPALMIAYILGDMYVLTNKRFYFYAYNLLPVALFVLYTALFHLQQLVLLVAFCTPLAISLKEMGLTQGPDLSIPTEPLMAAMMVGYIAVNLSKPIADRRFIYHPASLIIFSQLVWMLITSLASVDVVVSLKYLTARLWFIFSCYLIVPHLFANRKNLIHFVFAYSISLFIVVCYTISVHARFNFNDKAADWVVSPFYNDHTAYGAALAMFIPVLISFLFLKEVKRIWKLVAAGLFVAFMAGIVLSFARAGWLSLAVALAILVTLLLRIRFRTLLITFASVAVVFFVFKTDILMALGQNETDAKGGFSENLESVSNISTDASNLERINRWSCAVRMWEDKPFFGWGPGTYMFNYAPYQLSWQLTVISTNFATNGNAHSEYLGPLAEQGFVGMLIVVVLLFYTASLGYRLVYSLANRSDRIFLTGIFLGLMTYFVHGFFNNFLDTDKLSVPFWAFLAMMVSFDIYCEKKTATSR